MKKVIITNSVDSHIAQFPEDTQKLLVQLRKLIIKLAPNAEEKINYGIPTYYLHGNLVHFSGYKQHIGFYPGSSGIEAFKEELTTYKTAKGSIQFPLDKPLPIALITKIVKHRVKENITQNDSVVRKKTQRTCPQGHLYYKTSDCPSCPKCESDRKPTTGFLALLSAPARRALEHQKITTLKKLSQFSEKEILNLHGIGPSTLPILRKALKLEGYSFKK